MNIVNSRYCKSKLLSNWTNCFSIKITFCIYLAVLFMASHLWEWVFHFYNLGFYKHPLLFLLKSNPSMIYLFFTGWVGIRSFLILPDHVLKCRIRVYFLVSVWRKGRTFEGIGWKRFSSTLLFRLMENDVCDGNKMEIWLNRLYYISEMVFALNY